VVHAVAEADKLEGLLGLHGVFGDFGDSGDVFFCGEARDEVVELEYEADVVAPVLG
jgi:hypothetical protein